jgi:phospholipid/cholesterol/gamma-HCH transport system substrate-binding protein
VTMASKSLKIRAGLFAIGAAALAALGVLAFGAMRLLRGGDPYYVEYIDTVYGLEDGANVYMSGVRVGNVEDIELSAADPSRVRVRIVVREGTPVRADTRAMLQLTGITGLKEIDLRGGSPGAPPLPPGSMIATGETTLDRLEKRANQLADQAVAMTERANKILDNVGALTDPAGELLVTARRGVTDLAAAGAAMRAITEDNRAAVRRSIDAVGRTARGVDETVAQVRTLIRDNGAALRAVMFDLRQAGRSLKDLAREVRQRPSRLLYSGAQPDRKLP